MLICWEQLFNYGSTPLAARSAENRIKLSQQLIWPMGDDCRTPVSSLSSKIYLHHHSRNYQCFEILLQSEILCGEIKCVIFSSLQLFELLSTIIIRKKQFLYIFVVISRWTIISCLMKNITLNNY